VEVHDVEINDTFDFTAPPEVVFNSLMDADRTHRWLPSGVHIEWLDGRTVRVTAGSTGRTFAIDAEPDDLSLSWRPEDGRGPHGRVRAEDGPAGGSRLHVTVSVPDHGTLPARDLLSETMRHLQSDVSDNFNAG
jgi:uncharacterized protein YndB with AHSA1/START domain